METVSLATETERSDQQPSLVRGLSSARLCAAAGERHYWLFYFSYCQRYCRTFAEPNIVFSGMGARWSDFAVRMRRLRRTRLHVSRLRRTIHLPGEAYGDLVAFLYGWMLFAVANGGTIAALSVASAAYMGNIVPWMSQQHVMANINLPYPHRRMATSSRQYLRSFSRAPYAVGLLLIVILTYVNVYGLRWGALLQLRATRCGCRASCGSSNAAASAPPIPFSASSSSNCCNSSSRADLADRREIIQAPRRRNRPTGIRALQYI